MAKKDIFTKSHSGAHGLFNLHFIKTGLIPSQYGKLVQVLFERRQDADYELTGEFETEETEQFLSQTRELLTYIRTHFS